MVIAGFGVVGTVGVGPNGVVYQVVHPTYGELAIKMLNVPMPERGDPLIEEARLLAGVRHPNVLRVYQLVEHEGHMGVVQDLVHGPTLKDLLKDGAVDLEEALSLIGQLLEGVGAAHSRGVAHRNLSPNNVLLSVAEGNVVVRVADFGVASLAPPDPRRRVPPGVPRGTPGYMSPEQVSRPAQAGRRTDIFAIGALLYHLLSGRTPFNEPGDEEDAIMDRTRLGFFPPLHELTVDLPAEVLDAVSKALRVDAKARFGSCAEMATALGLDAVAERLASLDSEPSDDEPVPADPQPEPEPEPLQIPSPPEVPQNPLTMELGERSSKHIVPNPLAGPIDPPRQEADDEAPGLGDYAWEALAVLLRAVGPVLRYAWLPLLVGLGGLAGFGHVGRVQVQAAQARVERSWVALQEDLLGMTELLEDALEAGVAEDEVAAFRTRYQHPMDRRPKVKAAVELLRELDLRLGRLEPTQEVQALRGLIAAQLRKFEVMQAAWAASDLARSDIPGRVAELLRLVEEDPP